ncbi:hypothetical protein [Paenibacillus humicola]|uniref:hypothetical protein n=1 Tax=Paenibacillus humicola TaxID=3110540 RepID=UPI00237A8589|nr:hypothetical protein [Paenibacillus humicola]
MTILKSFALTVANLTGEMWLGMGRKPDFYDRQTATVQTKIGYAAFVAAAAALALGAACWLVLNIG